MLRLPIKSESLVMVGILLMLCLTIALPLIMIVAASFRTGAPFRPGSFTFENYARAFWDPLVRKAVLNTFVVATISTVLSVVFGITFAVILGRTDTPGRGVLTNLMLVPFFVSPLLIALGWSFAASPRIGVLNHLLMGIFRTETPLININSLFGIGFVTSLYVFSYVFLNVLSALESMDPTLEESARIVGANTRQTLFRITLGLMKPAIVSGALLSCIVSMENLSIPFVLGKPVGIYTITTEIYDRVSRGWGTMGPDWSGAMTLSVILLAIAMTGVYLAGRIWRRRREFVTITGKGRRSGVVKLGRWRYVTFVICCVFILISSIMSLLVIALTSFLKYYHPDISKWTLTLGNYHDVLFTYIQSQRGLVNSVILAGSAATICVLLSTFIVYLVYRTKAHGRALANYLSWVPHATPGIVMGAAFLWTFLLLPVGIYGTPWIILIAYIARHIPIATGVMSSSLLQIHQDLDDCSKVCGASWVTTLRRILMPLLKPAISSAWILLFIILFRDVSVSVFLFVPGTELAGPALFGFVDAGILPLTAAMAMMMMFVIVATLIIARKVAKVRVRI